MTPQEQLEMLFEKMRAYDAMTVEAQEYFKDEISALAEQIKKLQDATD